MGVKLFSAGGSSPIITFSEHIVSTATEAFTVGTSYPSPTDNTLVVDTVNDRVGVNTGSGTPDATVSIANTQASGDPAVDIYERGSAQAFSTKSFDILGHFTANAMDGADLRMFNASTQTVQIASDSVLPTFFNAGLVSIGSAAPTYALEVVPVLATANLTAKFQDARATTGSTFVLIKAGQGQSTNIFQIQNFAGTPIFTLNVSGEITTVSNIELIAAAVIDWLGRSAIFSTANGLISLTNAAGNDFGRLILGPATAASVALKRAATSVQIRLADDSGYGGIDAGTYAVGGAAGASGTFTTVDLKTVTVTNGLITSIV